MKETGSQDSSVRIVTKLLTGQPENRGFAQHPDQLWASTQHSIQQYQGLFIQWQRGQVMKLHLHVTIGLYGMVLNSAHRHKHKHDKNPL
jgi:hypothetical protein